ncbi:MAG: UDP-N-acetylmuramate dehydrogenase [Bacteroidetes bacterium]|jgi:UDP-N-acetylmuramate dehydrogenase|nr:UDP-N-acetylmuramate dehydrogenase [Bacteroidota bacterium]
MNTIRENYSLNNYNTFGLACKARYFLYAEHEQDIIKGIRFAREKNLPVFFLGGGSNVLLSDYLNKVVIYPGINYINIVKETTKHILIESSAGVNWDDFVAYCVKQNWQGPENLSLIPGNVGASPIQNIGAYGVEAKDFIVKVRGIQLDDLSVCEFNHNDCRFGYRDSVFKNELKDKVVITSVCFQLNKIADYKISYKPINELFEQKKDITTAKIRDAVISIRKSKLPDPQDLGNAGSFFKNPVITKTQYRFLKDMYPDIPHYDVANGIKVPAAWLLEKAGWKGYRDNHVGCHTRQPLVLVNYGNATFQDIFIFSEKIIKDINYCFNIRLEREVNIIE